MELPNPGRKVRWRAALSASCRGSVARIGRILPAGIVVAGDREARPASLRPAALMSPSRKALSCPHHGPAENPRTHRAFQLDDNVALTHQAAVDALLLSPLRRATVMSFVLAALCSFRLVVRQRGTSPRSSCSAHP